MGTGRALHKAGSDMVKALDPVLVFIRGTTNLFLFESAKQVSQPAMQVGCLLWFGNVYIIPIVNLSQCIRTSVSHSAIIVSM